MNSNDNENTPREELAWQAFRFVAGELDAREHEHFAALLVEDQAAREAVAEAYELAQASAMAMAVQPFALARPTSPIRSARWWWFAAGTAACVAIALGITHFSQPATMVAAATTDALAAQWSEVRQQQGDVSAWTVEEDLAGEAPSPDEWSLYDAAEVEDAAPLVAPEWMLAAVSEHELPGDLERGGEASQEQ
jgi:hypothetical protein